MTHARALRFDLEDPTHGQVPCAALVPEQHAHAACLFLYGGGGSRDNLIDLQATFEVAWNTGQLEPCIIATPDVGPWSFYLEDPQRGYAWESFITQRFAPKVQALTTQPTLLALAGISMGGYAALKLAFQHPQLFKAVAAISPMLEPYTTPNTVPLRNRYFYPPEVPQALLGEQRDEALYQSDHPTSRAKTNAATLKAHNLAIYIDAAGQDTLHAQDGAESLHRELWHQDIPHEYHLRKNTDHTGPDLPERLTTAFQWITQNLQPKAAPSPAPSLRDQLAKKRQAAATLDPTIHRHYGKL
jgi:S-formylglutathione hydrolase